jgi:hypothetical protein
MILNLQAQSSQSFFECERWALLFYSGDVYVGIQTHDEIRCLRYTGSILTLLCRIAGTSHYGKRLDSHPSATHNATRNATFNA